MRCAVRHVARRRQLFRGRPAADDEDHLSLARTFGACLDPSSFCIGSFELRRRPDNSPRL